MLRPPFHSSSSAPLFTAAEETQDPPIVQTHPGLDYDLHVNRTRQLVPSPGRIILSCRRSFVHVENRGGAALRLGDAVRGVAFRTLGPARHRPLSNHLSTRYDNKVVRVRVCGSGGGCGACTCAGWRVACSGRSVRPRAPNVTRETTPPPPDFFLCICIWYYVVVFRFYPSMLKEFRLPPAGLPATNEHK